MPKPALTPKAPIKTKSKTVDAPDAQTYEGGAGFERKAKSELFLLAVSNMVGEETFYEEAADRDERFRTLVAQVATKDPDWVARFVPYLRDTMNLRSAAIVMAAELVRTKLELVKVRPKLGEPGSSAFSPGYISNRQIINSALVRADEPAELLGYWMGRYGRQIPKPVRRGIADAAKRLYTEFAALKYAGNNGIQMADVLDLVHPDNRGPWQAALYEYILATRHNREALTKPVPEEAAPDKRALTSLEEQLPMIAARKRLEELPAETRTAEQLVGVDGITWEWASSWYRRKLDAAFWEALIPSMGYMALLRNLRNFDEAGVSNTAAALVCAKLADPEEVAKSRQLPLRFMSAYREVKNVRWHFALEQALNLALQNIPELEGKTLILLDCSSSMDAGRISEKSDVTYRQAASIFAAALALRSAEPKLVSYANEGFEVSVPKGGSILPLAKVAGEATTGGTETMRILQLAYNGQDRVVIITDEQTFRSHGMPHLTVPIYTFNLAGYKTGHLPVSPAERTYTFGGLTDAGFKAIELLDRGEDASWPF
jgi:hypothetical protein